MALDRRRLRAPGVRFGKLLGTGPGTGFGPGDADLTRWAALVVWADPRPRRRLRRPAGRPRLGAGSPRRRPARPAPAVQPRPVVRANRSATRPGAAAGGPVLALTRARLRPSRAVTFWRAPPVAAALRDTPGLLARFGVGEAPLGWQGTVSVWRSATDLIEFAYRRPEHRAAIMRTPSSGGTPRNCSPASRCASVGDRSARLGRDDEGRPTVDSTA